MRDDPFWKQQNHLNRAESLERLVDELFVIARSARSFDNVPRKLFPQLRELRETVGEMLAEAHSNLELARMGSEAHDEPDEHDDEGAEHG